MNGLPPGFPHGCSLRRATPADLASFCEFSRRTFVATYGAFHAPERMARHVAERLNDQRLGEELADPSRTVLVLAEAQAAVWVGYAMLRSGDGPSEVKAARPVEIERFYVDHAWHGRGLAAPLMAAALDAARATGHDVAWLGVWEQNPRAVRFYEKAGFRIVGRHHYVFDGTPEDDHLMALDL